MTKLSLDKQKKMDVIFDEIRNSLRNKLKKLLKHLLKQRLENTGFEILIILINI